MLSKLVTAEGENVKNTRFFISRRTSVYAKLFEATGIGYPDLCDRLVELAVERHKQARSYEF